MFLRKAFAKSGNHVNNNHNSVRAVVLMIWTFVEREIVIHSPSKAIIMSKEKEGKAKNNKTAPAKNLKEKRAAKEEKRKGKKRAE